MERKLHVPCLFYIFRSNSTERLANIRRKNTVIGQSNCFITLQHNSLKNLQTCFCEIQLLSVFMKLLYFTYSTCSRRTYKPARNRNNFVTRQYRHGGMLTRCKQDTDRASSSFGIVYIVLGLPPSGKIFIEIERASMQSSILTFFVLPATTLRYVYKQKSFRINVLLCLFV